jgi:hypothetical protein
VDVLVAVRSGILCLSLQHNATERSSHHIHSTKLMLGNAATCDALQN